ncbi:MAG: diguanylate cyclase [Proteobacteria bacterium]|nr:diguanylate cyclase [Pseudomonadota bacterium]MCH8277370.1 diguanylate cyclase [Pseudomonadota bacterium]
MNILVADDEVSIRELVGEILEGDGYNITLAEDGEDALEKFNLSWHEIVFSDIRMPKMNGIELLTAVKEINENTQFVIMTSHASIENSVDALKKGAFDYIIKPFEDLDIISDVAARAIANLSGIRRQQYLLSTLTRQNQELDHLNKEFREMAIRDGLTGLHNHRYAKERLDSEFDRSARFDRDLAVLFMDLDHFKFYNDAHGHQAGDDILQTLAALMTKNVRESDTLARWGGEEFVVIAPETGPADACKLAERIRKAVESHNFPNAAKQPLGRVSLSIGIAARSSATESAEKLLRFADDATYAAKDGGRNRCVYCIGPEKMKAI